MEKMECTIDFLILAIRKFEERNCCMRKEMLCGERTESFLLLQEDYNWSLSGL